MCSLQVFSQFDDNKMETKSVFKFVQCFFDSLYKEIKGGNICRI